MSYDIDVGSRYNNNYTFNMSQFFRDFIIDTGKGGGLRELDGLTGARAGSILRAVMNDINKARCDYGDKDLGFQYDSENGWGTVLGATIFLAELMGACYAYPEETVSLYL